MVFPTSVMAVFSIGHLCAMLPFAVVIWPLSLVSRSETDLFTAVIAVVRVEISVFTLPSTVAIEPVSLVSKSVTDLPQWPRRSDG